MRIRTTVGVLILLTVLLLAACRKDVEPPDDDDIDGPTIVGNYSGTYRFTQIESGVDTTIDSTQSIRLQFRADEYLLSIGNPPDSLQVFCDIIGTYELGSSIYFSPADSNYTRGVCPPHWGFGGYFGLDQTTDTLRLLNDGVDSFGVRRIRELRLVNVN